ncbi:gamma-glutamylcyclotransferase-like [Onthophagus taurus]|uniref:gamma-glutamylcyclotransferase-like n=1 Tax=Onthophagus taurus TaxID=166361 RepID=UPI000C1FEEFF|nr:gamma-glutamylcyclotransferase-like [Onthophagus taurus]
MRVTSQILAMSKTFSYFAYGSNLLSKRIHINNPSAVLVGPGKLLDHRLDFLTYSKRWGGASATIVPMKNSHVWGAIWEIDNDHMKCLDNQEGVQDNLYFAKTVEIVLPNGEKRTCRVYQQTATPEHVDDIKELPKDRQPSTVYLTTIILGAEESCLPDDYREYLKSIPDNGYKGKVDIGLDLKIVD